MLLRRRTIVSLLFPVIVPLFAQVQGPIAPPSTPAGSDPVDQNSSDGLRMQLQSVLTAAKDNDVPKLKSLIQAFEIPDYRDWFTKTFGNENGERQTEYHSRNFADGDTYLETLFTQLASEDGEFTIRRVSARAEGGEPGESASAIKGWQGRVEPFVVTWKNRGLSASPRFLPIGTFIRLDGSFRLVSAFRRPEYSPGMSPYPNLSSVDPPGKAADSADNPPGGANEQVAYRPGAGGVGYPSCIYCPSPEFTNEARAKHVEGTVVLQVIVQPDGQATDIQVVKTIDAGLAQKAVEAVSKWRFNPAHRADGEAVPVHVPIEVTFRLAK